MTSDDITPEEKPYNPLDKKNLGVSVADAVLAKTISPLPPSQQFNGAGIYAIYYTGNFPSYGAISLRNRNQRNETPIYVGKAVPAGARKGGFGLDIPAGPVLYRRLCEHAQSIEQTSNLQLKDFYCRYLVVDDIWIPLVNLCSLRCFRRYGTNWSTVLGTMIRVVGGIINRNLLGMFYIQGGHGPKNSNPTLSRKSRLYLW